MRKKHHGDNHDHVHQNRSCSPYSKTVGGIQHARIQSGDRCEQNIWEHNPGEYDGQLKPFRRRYKARRNNLHHIRRRYLDDNYKHQQNYRQNRSTSLAAILAFSFPSLVNICENVGTKAALKAPSANSLLKKFGKRKATKMHPQ